MTKAFKQAQNGVWGKNEFMKKSTSKKNKQTQKWDKIFLLRRFEKIM